LGVVEDDAIKLTWSVDAMVVGVFLLSYVVCAKLKEMYLYKVKPNKWTNVWEYCQMNMDKCVKSKHGNLVLYHMGLQRHECLKVEHGVAEACTISVQKQRILLYTYQLLLHISWLIFRKL
jgi:hypothetical protein